MTLHNRVRALESRDGEPLSPRVSDWLGHNLSDGERALLFEDAGVETDWDAIDTSDWSREAKAWLGVI